MVRLPVPAGPRLGCCCGCRPFCRLENVLGLDCDGFAAPLRGRARRPAQVALRIWSWHVGREAADRRARERTARDELAAAVIVRRV